MRKGDVVKIYTFGQRIEIQHPLYAFVIGGRSSNNNAELIIVSGDYKVFEWVGIGYTFILPHRPERGSGGRWNVVHPNEVPDDVWVEIAKQALLSEGEK